MPLFLAQILSQIHRHKDVYRHGMRHGSSEDQVLYDWPYCNAAVTVLCELQVFHQILRLPGKVVT